MIPDDASTQSCHFEWDPRKEAANRVRHGVSFMLAQMAFWDPHRLLAEDVKHSRNESRYYCIGKAGGGVLTVRFTFRSAAIRIIGAGYWRKGRDLYEKHNQVH